MTEDTRQKREEVRALRSEIAALVDLHDDQIINATLAHLIAAQLSRYDEKDRKRLRIGIFGLSRRLTPATSRLGSIFRPPPHLTTRGHRSHPEVQRKTGAPTPKRTIAAGRY